MGNYAAGLLFLVALSGCHRASVTAVPLSPWNRCEPEGIPYYLPKPLLVISKNVRHIDEGKVGLTNPVPIPNGFDNQASYADIKANVTVPGSGNQVAGLAATSDTTPGPTPAFDPTKPDARAIEERMTPLGRVADDLSPDCFYTYQIVFVPDLSQKYGLRVKGGPGEIRAAMNLVNGWMYTGMGPYYLKNSSTAQNLMAFGVGSMYAGHGAAEVLNEVTDLAKAGAGETPERASMGDGSTVLSELKDLVEAARGEQPVPQEILNYAEISIYEPKLASDGSTTWELIAQHSFDRQYFRPATAMSGTELLNLVNGAQNVEQKRMERAQMERGELGPIKTSGSSASQPGGSGGPKQPMESPPLLSPSAGQNSADPSLQVPLKAPPSAAPEELPVIPNQSTMLDELERSALGLPVMQAKTTPAASEVNVNVNLDPPEHSPPLRRHRGILKRPPLPTISQKRLSFRDASEPAMDVNGSGPGAALRN